MRLRSHEDETMHGFVWMCAYKQWQIENKVDNWLGKSKSKFCILQTIERIDYNSLSITMANQSQIFYFLPQTKRKKPAQQTNIQTIEITWILAGTKCKLFTVRCACVYISNDID